MSATTSRDGNWRFPGLSDPIQEFFLCILFYMLLPFVPVFAEFVLRGQIEKKTMLLFLAMYMVSIGVSSHSRLMFGAAIVIGLLYSMLFGLAAAGGTLAEWIYSCGYIILVVCVGLHAAERYNRHIADKDRFWDFSGEAKR